MPSGFRFHAEFVNPTSAHTYFTWSAAQMTVYNAKVDEANYFYRFAQVFGGQIPKTDQKYSHLITDPVTKKRWLDWLEPVPSQVMQVGAVLYYQAVGRAKAGVTNKPKTKRIKGAERSLWLPAALFTIRQVRANWYELVLGTKTRPCGRIRFKAHRPFDMPRSVHIKTKGSKLFVSFSTPEGVEELSRYPETEEEIKARIKEKTPEELLARTVGCDRGVVTPLQTQTKSFTLSRVEKQRMHAKDKRIVTLQKKFARQVPYSKGWLKTRKAISDANTYGVNVRQNFAHQVSHALVTDSDTDVIVFEDLKINNMTKAPKPKYDESGKALHNQRAALASLHREILEMSAWGRIREYTESKGTPNGKLVVAVPAAYSSQECPKCGYVSAANRPEQALFACTNPSCGFNADHRLTADQVAAMNIAARGVKKVLSGAAKPKERKRLLHLRKALKSSEQGRDGTSRTMRSEELEALGAAKPAEPAPSEGNRTRLAVKPERPTASALGQCPPASRYPVFSPAASPSEGAEPEELQPDSHFVPVGCAKGSSTRAAAALSMQ